MSSTTVQAYPPSEEFAAQANASAEIYARADADRLEFWAEQARRLDWATDFTDTLDWSNAPVRQVVRRRQAQRLGQLR